jgi:hypothetical protein
MSEYCKLRSGLQLNAPEADATVVELMGRTLRAGLESSGLLHSIEVEGTEDRDRRVVAMVGFAPGVPAEVVAAFLERLWREQVSYRFWEAHSVLVEADHIELQAATRAGADGHYVTVHLVAQQAEAPERVQAPGQGADVAPMPGQRRRRWLRPAVLSSGLSAT